MSEVKLFNMPFSMPRHAPLGLGIVHTLLSSGGISVQSHHITLELYAEMARKLGPERAQAIYDRPDVGEVISGALFRSEFDPLTDKSLELASFLDAEGVPGSLYGEACSAFEGFANEWFANTDLSDVSACGFTLIIRQTMASLYWAKRIKKQWPHIAIVMGGSHCEDPMGLELLRAFDFVDVVARGECDSSVLPLFRAIERGNLASLREVPNLAYRMDGVLHTTQQEEVDIRTTVTPDYHEFQRAYEDVEIISGATPTYYVEGSRGCWWGQKHHCVFCGINGQSMKFREKAADEVLAEIKGLVETYGTLRYSMADTILSTRHLNDLIPKLETMNERYDTEMLVEVKSNMRKEDIYRLARAGCIALQPGIESFSDHVLQQMDKGNTALQQVQFLKWCREAGMYPFYSILTNVVGETVQDYVETLACIEKIVHITPPAGVVEIELNRYAPYFENWKRLGFDEPKPARYYRLMFGATDIDLGNFAYHFEGLHPSTVSSELAQAREAIRTFWTETWRPGHDNATHEYRCGPNFLRIDRRGKKNDSLVLRGIESELYMACDRIRSLPSLQREFGGRMPEEALRDLLNEFSEEGYMARSAAREEYLSLALRASRAYPMLPGRGAESQEQDNRTPEKRVIPLVAR